MSPTPHPARQAGPLMALAGAVAFSGKAIIVKLGYRHGVDAITLLTLRMALALPLFLAMAAWAGRGRPRLTLRQAGAVAGLGFCGYYLSSYLDFLGLQHVSAGLERLILYTSPAIVLLINRVVLGQRTVPRQWLALLLAYCGLALVFGQELHLRQAPAAGAALPGGPLPGSTGAGPAGLPAAVPGAMAQGGPDVVLGAALVLASTVSYAVYLVASGAVVRQLGALRLTGWATGVAGLLCLAHFGLARMLAGEGPLAALQRVPAPVWGLSVLNATLCTVLPVWLVMAAIERIGASRTAQLGMVGPISTVLLGVLLLGESFTALMAAGTLCVMAAVALLARR